MTQAFFGKVAAVTGAASGIGLASAQALLQGGARVVLIDRDPKALAAAGAPHGDAASPLRLLAYLALAITLIVLDDQAGWLSRLRAQANVLVQPVWALAGLPGRLGTQVKDNAASHGQLVSENRELRNVTSPRLRELGRDLYALWPSLLVEPSTFKLISTEERFKNLPTDRYPELEPWEHYMRSRYSFLK